MFTNWYVIILIFDLPLCHSTHICRYAKAHIYNFSLVHSSTNTYMMTACRNTNCEQLWHNPFTAQDSKFFAGRIKLFVVGRIVCTVPILDSPTVQPSAGDDASHIKNKPSRVIKTVSQNRRKTTCRANIQFKIFQKQWLHFCKLSLRKPLKIAARRVLSPNRTPFPPPPSNPSTTFGIRNKAILPATLKMRTAHRWFLSRPEARKYCGARTFWRLFLKLTRPDDWKIRSIIAVVQPWHLQWICMAHYYKRRRHSQISISQRRAAFQVCASVRAHCMTLLRSDKVGGADKCR